MITTYDRVHGAAAQKKAQYGKALPTWALRDVGLLEVYQAEGLTVVQRMRRGTEKMALLQGMGQDLFNVPVTVNPEMRLKMCKCCGEKKPTVQFSPKRDAADRLYPHCLTCKAEKMRSYRKSKRRV